MPKILHKLVLSNLLEVAFVEVIACPVKAILSELIFLVDIKCYFTECSKFKFYNLLKCDWNHVNVAFDRFKVARAWLPLCGPLATLDSYFKPISI